MVDRLLRVFHREWSGLHDAAFLLGGFAMLSQLLGLVRDRLLAHQFGASQPLDIYYAAFRIPDFLYASIASFVAVTVLIPFLLERLHGSGGKEEGQRFFSSVFLVFSLCITLAAAIAYGVLPALAGWLVPGFGVEEREMFVALSRILLLSPIILGLSNLFGSVTQTFRRFLVFAIGPVLYNVGIITGILFFLPVWGIEGLAWGVVFGALLHMGIQVPVVLRQGFAPRFPETFDIRGVWNVVLLSLPRTLSLSSANFTIMVLLALASHIAAGSIAVFQLAFNLQSIPLSIVGMSYSVAAFPSLARTWAEGNTKEFARAVGVAIRHIVFWSFPAIALFVVLRAQIVRTILGSGAFDWTATRLTAAALALFAVSISAQCLLLLLLRAFYAMGETRAPLKWSIAGAGATITIAYFLTVTFDAVPVFRFFVEALLRVEDIPGTEVLMLPLAFSIGSICSAMGVFWELERRLPEEWSLVRKSILHAFSASVIMGLVAYHGLQLLDDYLNLNTLIGIFLQGFLAGFLGIILGIFLLRIMENRELAEISKSLHHRFWKAKPMAAEQETL